MYGDPKQQQNRLPPPPMMQQPLASSTTNRERQRRTVDYTSTVVRYTQSRMWQQDSRGRPVLPPTSAAAIDMLPPAAYLDNPSTSFAAKYVSKSVNKTKTSINRVLWTPTGSRLITGSQSGRFTLWDGKSFHFKKSIQVHEKAIRCMVWSHNDNCMVSGDDGGDIKYWQDTMSPLKAIKSAHKKSVRDLSFCRTDLKFCSCSADATVKVWDFARGQVEQSFTGHGGDLKSIDWHPTKSLLVSGGRDNLVKLWDAKTGRELRSFHGHNKHVLCVKWNQNGNWLLTAGKDQIIKLYDIRAMEELNSFQDHQSVVTVLAWHPFHEEYFVSGNLDGKIFHWFVGHETSQVEVDAHYNSVMDIAWHPIGNLLCSGSNDEIKFWCRSRPGDTALDRCYTATNQGYGERYPALANEGPSAAGLTRNEGTIPRVGLPMPLPDASTQGDQQQPLPVPGSLPFRVPRLPPSPHPSFVVGNQQQGYQQNPQQIQQQQMPHMSMGPPNMQQLQPLSHVSLRPHPHFQLPPRPPLGYVEQNPALAGCMPGIFKPPKGSKTLGPFAAAGLTQNEGTIPSIGVPMPLLTQGDQPQPLQGSMPFRDPRLPHPSFVVANQLQGYQQNPQQIQQQQMPRTPMPPNMQQLQPLSHPHLQVPPKRPPQLPIRVPNPMTISLILGMNTMQPAGGFPNQGNPYQSGSQSRLHPPPPPGPPQ